MSDDSSDAGDDGVWVFRLRTSGGYSSRGPLPSFGRGDEEKEYRIIEDESVASELQEKTLRGENVFKWLPPEDVEAALGSAKNAVAQIEQGKHDGHLDMLLVAERRAYGRRVTVLEAIAERNQKIVHERADDDDDAILSAGDIVTA